MCYRQPICVRCPHHALGEYLVPLYGCIYFRTNIVMDIESLMAIMFFSLAIDLARKGRGIRSG